MCRSQDPPRPWRGPKRRRLPGSGLVNVSKNIERLAVEHGDTENQEGPVWGVDPCGARSEEELLRLRGGQGCRLQGLRWRVFRFFGPERGWEDDDHEDDLRGRHTDGWRARCRRSRRLPPR